MNMYKGKEKVSRWRIEKGWNRTPIDKIRRDQKSFGKFPWLEIFYKTNWSPNFNKWHPVRHELSTMSLFHFKPLK